MRPVGPSSLVISTGRSKPATAWTTLKHRASIALGLAVRSMTSSFPHPHCHRAKYTGYQYPDSTGGKDEQLLRLRLSAGSWERDSSLYWAEEVVSACQYPPRADLLPTNGEPSMMNRTVGNRSQMLLAFEALQHSRTLRLC